MLAETPSIVLNAPTLVAAARVRGVFLSSSGKRAVRFVTHLDITRYDCVIADCIVGEILAQ